MSQLREKFAVEVKYEPFYTGGKIYISKDGAYVFCGCGNKVQIIEVQTGQTKKSISTEEDEEITHFCLSPDNKFLILATKHLVIRQWNWEDGILVRSWKAIHIAPVLTMDFDVSSTLLATGSADSTVKLWDIHKQHCTHNLKGHQGVISVVKFHPDNDILQLYSAADDYKVKIWDLRTSHCIATVEAHFSVVTSMIFTPDGNTMYSGGRDGVVSVWNTKELKVNKAIPVFESVEDVILLPDELFPELSVETERPHILTAGSKGTLRVWNVEKSSCVYVRKQVIGRIADTDQNEQNIVQAVYNSSLRSIAVVTFDNNITLCNINDLSLKKQFCGNMDQVLDVQFLGENDTHLAVATNSEHLKVFEMSTWNCQLCQGHTDLIMGLTVHKKKNLLATCSKDNTVRVWKFNPEMGSVTCVGVGHGHTHIVGTVSFSSLNANWLVSGGQDFTLKRWDIPQNTEKSTISLSCSHTERVHDKDINCVVVAPNDKFIATGSHDRTAKLWNVETFSLMGVMRGHKRGVWCVQFSPVDQCLATSSGDGTIKIWSVKGLECLKTFEGHDSAVLRVNFMTRGMQLLSCGSDGLLKIWTIKTNVCTSTMDEHEDKIWAITVSKEEDRIVTGGADSCIIVWKDVTEEEAQKKNTDMEEFILREQELSNLMQQKKYLKAIGLAITLEQPFRVMTILREILYSPNGKEELEQTLGKLRLDQLDSVLRYSSEWNTNSRHCHEAQFVLNVVLKSYSAEEIMKFPNIKATMEALIPYTERHFVRMNKLLQQATFLEYTWHCMRCATDQALPLEEDQNITEEIQDKARISENPIHITKDSKSENASDTDSEVPTDLKTNQLSDQESDGSSDSESNTELYVKSKEQKNKSLENKKAKIKNDRKQSQNQHSQARETTVTTNQKRKNKLKSNESIVTMETSVCSQEEMEAEDIESDTGGGNDFEQDNEAENIKTKKNTELKDVNLRTSKLAKKMKRLKTPDSSNRPKRLQKGR